LTCIAFPCPIYPLEQASKSSLSFKIQPFPTLIKKIVLGVLGANKLSGLVARDSSGFMVNKEVSHAVGVIATGHPENAI
jgi:hypothetical protein